MKLESIWYQTQTGGRLVFVMRDKANWKLKSSLKVLTLKEAVSMKMKTEAPE